MTDPSKKLPIYTKMQISIHQNIMESSMQTLAPNNKGHIRRAANRELQYPD